jgi:tRNA A37 threonylcarbamoyladenosine dehydratase
MTIKPEFQRLQLLTGKDALERIHQTNVIIFGIGGVGSWAAEALVRSGIMHLTIVDSDVVCVTNINRQVQALHSTVGKVKTEELKKRLHDINPHAEITAIQRIFDKETVATFNLNQYEYVIDAIDSLSNKVELIIRAKEAGAKVYTALGASNKMDITQIRTASLWKSQGCKFGRYVRKYLRRRGFHGEVTCVYSEEHIPPESSEIGCGTGNCVCPKTIQKDDGTYEDAHEWCSSKQQINGSAVHITGTYGFILAGLVIKDVYECAKVDKLEKENLNLEMTKTQL